MMTSYVGNSIAKCPPSTNAWECLLRVKSRLVQGQLTWTLEYTWVGGKRYLEWVLKRHDFVYTSGAGIVIDDGVQGWYPKQNVHFAEPENVT